MENRCARCAQSDVETVLIDSGGLTLELDLCQVHVAALVAGSRVVGSRMDDTAKTATVVPLRSRSTGPSSR